MSYNYTKAAALTTDLQYAKAYAEYWDNVVADYSELVDCISATDSSIPLPANITNVQLKYPSLNLDRQVVIKGKYTVSVRQFITDYYQALSQADYNIDHDQQQELDLPITIHCSDGSEVMLPVSEVFADINAALHAAVVEQATATAYAVGNTIVDRVQLIRDAIGAKFASNFTDVSNTLNYAIEAVKRGVNFKSYANSRLEKSGAIAGQTSGDVSESDDMLYTGTSSIVAGLYYAGAKIALVGSSWIMKACSFSVAMTLKATKAVGSLLVKGFTWIREHIVNPNEICTTDNDDGNFTFAVGHYDNINYLPYDSILIPKFEKGPIHFDFPTCEVICTKDSSASPYVNPVVDILSGMQNLATALNTKQHIANTPEWNSEYTFADYVSDLCLFFNVQANDTILDGLQQLYMTLFSHLIAPDNILEILRSIYNEAMEPAYAYPVHVMIKYKIINPDKIYALTAPTEVQGLYEYDKDEVFDCLTNLATDPTAYICGDPLDGSSQSGAAIHKETIMFRGLCSSVMLSALMFDLLNKEARGDYLDPSLFYERDYTYILPRITSSFGSGITNLDWYKAICECIFKGDFSPNVIETHDNVILRILENIFAYQQDHPDDHAFWPYTTREVGWSPASYYIMNDKEVQSYIDNFAIRAIAIIAVAFIGYKAFKGLKNNMLKISLNEQGALWKASEAASQGTLTQDIINAYRKAHLKNAVVNFLAGNLLGTTTKAGSALLDLNRNYDEVETDLSPVIRLIRGY